MSGSIGGQWRLLRRQLAGSALGDHLDKLLQRMKTDAPEQWNGIIKKLEQVVLIRLSSESKATPSQSGVNSTVEQQSEVRSKAAQPETAPKLQGSAPALQDSVPSHLKDISLEGLWAGLRLRKDLSLGNVSKPLGWKTSKPVVTKSSIHSRTSYVISALSAARSAACLARRCHDLLHHLHHYPEARDLAVKEGAVRVLLRAQRSQAGDDAVRAAVNEALALVGWCDPPGGRGPRVLALDGGGVRGVVAIEVLRHLEHITGRPVRELFDFVVGVSTGAIIAAVVACNVGSLETAATLYRKLAHDMFGNTSVLGGTSRLVWRAAYYDTAAWEALLRRYLGEERLTRAAGGLRAAGGGGPRLALVSARGRGSDRLQPYVFRSYEPRYRVRAALCGGSAAPVWAAVRASAAAPTYFEEFPHDGHVHHDGGLLVNNPAGVAILETKLQYGSLENMTLVSVGCGRAPAPPPRAGHAPPTSWRDKFNAVLDSATDTEGVHLVLNEVLPARGYHYYRVNPPLTTTCAMDEVRDDRLQAVLDDTHAYIRRNKHKLEAAARALTAPRSVTQRVRDALHRRAVELGAAH